MWIHGATYLTEIFSGGGTQFVTSATVDEFPSICSAVATSSVGRWRQKCCPTFCAFLLLVVMRLFSSLSTFDNLYSPIVGSSRRNKPLN